MASTSTSTSAPSPTTINIRDTPSVVEWVDAETDGDAEAETETETCPCHLARASNSSPITFSLFFDPSSNAAFFKLRVTVLVRGPGPGPPRDKTQFPVYLFIYPDSVLSITHSEPSTLSPAAVSAAPSRLSSGCRTACLRFTLSRPAPVVAPLQPPLAPRSRRDTQVLRSLRMLTSTTAIDIHLASDALPPPRLVSLVCGAASASALKPSLNHGDLSQLYGGRGGRVVDERLWDSLLLLLPPPAEHVPEAAASASASASAATAAAAHETHETPTTPGEESPPRYDELVPQPPAVAPRTGPSSKRPRTGSRSPEGSGGGGGIGGMDNLADVTSICNKAVAEQMARVRAELRDDIRSEVRSQLSGLEERLMERADRRLGELVAELRDDLAGQIDATDGRIDEMEGRLEGFIDQEIEDRALGVKIDMEDFVKDEMAIVQDTVIKYIEDGSVSLLF